MVLLFMIWSFRNDERMTYIWCFLFSKYSTTFFTRINMNICLLLNDATSLLSIIMGLKLFLSFNLFIKRIGINILNMKFFSIHSKINIFTNYGFILTKIQSMYRVKCICQIGIYTSYKCKYWHCQYLHL